MDHTEVMQKMITERYLLNELTPEAREAFEEHLFDCPECVIDLRAGAAFIDEAKSQLPKLAGVLTAQVIAFPRKPEPKQAWRRGWLRPAFAASAFVTLLLVVGYQNLVSYPALRTAASQPRIIPWTPLHGAMRGNANQPITADHRNGVALPVDLPPQPSMGAFASYSFDLYDPQGKPVWSGVASASDAGEDQRLSLVIPGSMLRDGTYTVAVSAVTVHGERTAIDRYSFDLHLTD